MHYINKFAPAGVAVVCLAIAAGFGSGRAFAESGDRDLVYLKQGWSADERQDFYHLTQGSQLVPYTWFLALEQADSQELFRTNSHLERLGYLSQRPHAKRNPDGLPIGFTKDQNRDVSYRMKKGFLGPGYEITDYPSTNQWFGLTCAACHTNDIHVNGKVIRIDGAPPLIDHETLLAELAAALSATNADNEKFTRFAKRVGEAAGLKEDLEAYTEAIVNSVKRNKADYPYGFGRLDAFGAILNQVCETALEIPENHRVSNAPVSYPFLWNTPHLDWVQWNGAVANPIGRNVGEVLGVYGHLKLTGTPTTGQFGSSANILNLGQLERWLTKLSAPQWPERYLGKIDADKAKQGEALYAANCVGCHGIRDAERKFPMTEPNRFGKRFIRIHMVPLQEIGTDELMAKNFADRTAKPGALRPFLHETLRDAPEVPGAALLNIATRMVIELKLAEMQPPLDDQQKLELTGYRDPDPAVRPPNIRAYKARPLDGVWATAPYLHNGSVPNLYQLLLPAEQRVKTFYVGNREFDPVNVGFRTAPYQDGFQFHTETADGKPIPGNSNAGHSGGNYTQTKAKDASWHDFTDAERWALVEYIKTLH